MKTIYSMIRVRYVILFMVVIIISYLLLTPTGAVRLAILIHGFPVKSFTVILIQQDWASSGYDITFFIDEDNPIIDGFDYSLFQWNVKKVGIFYFAKNGVA